MPQACTINGLLMGTTSPPDHIFGQYVLAYPMRASPEQRPGSLALIAPNNTFNSSL